MAEAIRVLHVFGATNLGGAESRVMDLYRTIDKTKVQFDFVIHTDKECYFDKEIIELGGRIFHVPPFRVYNIFSYKRAFRELFEEHSEFKVVHGHMTSTASIYLPIAKKAGIRTTIAHARSAGVDKGVKGRLTRFLRRNLAKKADVLLACSKLAGQAVFGRKAWENGRVIFVPNAIEALKYRYDQNVREQVRKELGLEDKLVIGHVGSFRYAKNHEYLINVFGEILKLYAERKMDKNSELVLLGEGKLMDGVKRQVERLGISDHVLFLGNRRDVWKYYQAFDYIIFPSRYEGMPGTIVEAQVAGVKCLISDRISDDTIYTDLVKQKDIDLDPEKWAREVLDDLNYERRDYYDNAVEAGFDVVGQTQKMLNFYETGIWE